MRTKWTITKGLRGCIPNDAYEVFGITDLRSALASEKEMMLEHDWQWNIDNDKESDWRVSQVVNPVNDLISFKPQFPHIYMLDDTCDYAIVVCFEGYVK